MLKYAATAPDIEIIAQDLQVAYDQTLALDLPDLSFAANVTAIVGHNGAGKSTFLKTLLQLLKPRQGTLSARICSDQGEQWLDPAEHMAFCPETGSVFADISVESYVKLWCRIKAGDGAYYRKGGAEVIERLQLAPLLPKLGRELSRGQRRRVQTAIGFLSRPRLFLFDEPFSGLDIQRARELGQAIMDYSSHNAAILASHRMDIIERLADYVIVLKEGRIAARGSVPEVAISLAGRQLLLSDVNGHSNLIPELRAAFPDLLINRLGARVALLGKTANPDAVRNFLVQRPFIGIKLAEETPSLVDALNYHLSN